MTNPVTHVEAEIERVVQTVNEWDDRTSPDDYPDHLLITSEELADILRNFAEVITQPAPTNMAGLNPGLDRAVKFIEKQRDEYVQEFGMYDGSTGVTEFSDAGEEYLSVLDELIEGIKGLHQEVQS